jgi:hypothetical protein
MSWLLTDVNLLQTDAEQLRLHLTWLVEDLRAHGAILNGQATITDALATHAADCLARLVQLEALIAQVRAVAR